MAECVKDENQAERKGSDVRGISEEGGGRWKDGNCPAAERREEKLVAAAMTIKADSL